MLQVPISDYDRVLSASKWITGQFNDKGHQSPVQCVVLMQRLHRLYTNHGVIWNFAPIGLPLKFKLLPEKLKELGYETHLIGKWHLGYCHWNYTPTFRGFDTFVGSFTGAQTYFTHAITGPLPITDFYNGTQPLLEYQNVHSSVQQKYLNLYLDHPDEGRSHQERRIFSAMVSALDDNVGQVVKLLKEFNIYQDSIIVFHSDNGGHINLGRNNFPLRGIKNTLYEGGTRTVGFIHSPLITTTGYVYNGVIHVVDWFATLFGLVGGALDPDIDGLDVWKSIIENAPSPRTEFIYNIDNYGQSFSGAIRDGDWKLNVGRAGLPNGRYTVDNVTYEYEKFKLIDTIIHEPEEPLVRLYNIKGDLPQKVDQLREKLRKYRNQAVKPLWCQNEPEAPSFMENGIIRPRWCEPAQTVELN